MPVAGLTLGWPAEDPPLRDRLPLDGLVHRETYHDPADARVREIYRDRETAGRDRYMARPELRERVQAAGAENLAQVYASVKYPRADAHAVAWSVRA